MTEAKATRLPGWAWAVLAALITYQAVMYGWVMRIAMSLAVVLMPWLLRQPGYRLYDNVILQHTPGTMWLGAALHGLLPDPLLRVRLMMIVLAALSTALVFWLACRWWGWRFGLVGAALYALWGPVIMDHPMYFEVPIGLLTVVAVAFWHRADATWWEPVLAGFFVGLAVLFKQHALAVIVVFGVWRLLGPDRRVALSHLVGFVLAAALPLGAVLLGLATQGRLQDALFWLWTFNLGAYSTVSTIQLPPAREMILVVAWLALVPFYALHIVPLRQRWHHEGILLLGLIPALSTPVFPRYGRFHLSAAVPIVALVGAGALAYLFRDERGQIAWGRRIGGLVGIGAAGLLIMALLLPTYYRVKLGPKIGEFEALVPIGEWVAGETGAGPGTRVWMVVEIDPTDNFYVVSGYLPPTLLAQTYAWYYAAPGLTERMLVALDSEPPVYAVMIEKWRTTVPQELLAYLEAHYTSLDQTEMPYEMGTVTLYELAS
jgi:hypothetical protein